MKLFCVFVFVASMGLALALTTEEINALREAAQPHLAACAEKYSISQESIAEAHDNKNIEALDKCFFVCFFKIDGIINDEGLYDREAFKNFYSEHVNNEDTVKELDTIGETCTKVNEEEVTDGVNGCDRGKLLVTCLLTETSKIIAE